MLTNNAPTYQWLVHFFVILKERRIIMKLLDGREVTVRRYQEQDELFLRADRIEIPASMMV